MPARIFRTMPKVFLKTFGEPAKALWSQHGKAEAIEISVIFHRAYAQLDVSGIAVDDARPTVWVSESEVKAFAGSRGINELIDNRDTITIGNTVYKVSSFKPDGYGMIEIELRI